MIAVADFYLDNYVMRWYEERDEIKDKEFGVTDYSEKFVLDEKEIRKILADDGWLFCVSDVIKVLTGSSRPSAYWTAMKARVSFKENFQLSTICRRFKIPGKDNKLRSADCADIIGLSKIIQYLPSKRVDLLAKINAMMNTALMDGGKMDKTSNGKNCEKIEF